MDRRHDRRHLFDGISNAEFRFLIEKNADGIVVADRDGVVLFANPAVEEMFGRPLDTLIGSPVGVMAVAGETTEIVILRPNGTRIDAEMRVVETTWHGEPALLASLRDISARRAIEERLRQSHKMEAIGRLTAGVAHDFNNLLTIVIGNLEIIQRRVAAGDTDPRVPRAAENAMQGAKRAATLTQRLLAFSRRQPLDPAPIDVNKLVTGMSELFHRTLGETVEIETAVAAGLWQTHADSNQLEAALLNLAVNARDAMPDGGKLTIATANVELDRSHAAANGDVTPGPYVMISVADTGVGMTDEVLAQAFEPFFTTKDVGQGTGLGLSQVYGFVKQSGGHVQIDSEPSVGTTVKIYLPRRHFAKDSSERAEESVRAPVAAPTETILVVEDEDGVRSYGTEILRELGYAVLEAIDGPSALEVLDREPDIDLLFTDIGLPGGIDGRQLADEARARRPGLKVLLTTAYAGKALIEDGRLAPGLQLLPKPFTYGALATKVRELLDLAGDAPRVLVVGNVAGTTVRETLVTAGCRVDEAATPGDALAKFHAAGKRLRAAVVDMGLFDGQGDALIAELRAARPALPIVLAMDGDARAPESAVDDERLTVLAKPIDGRRLRTALQMLGVKMPTQRRPTRPGTEPRRTD